MLHASPGVFTSHCRRIQQERQQKSSISRIEGLDPPSGTRDPALLWPSVLATPAASADEVSVARSGSQADDGDHHIARRPASVASNHSSLNSASSTHQSSPTSSRPAKHGILTLLTALTVPSAAATESCHHAVNAKQQASIPCSGTSSNSSASSSEGRRSGDCRMNINDIQRCRDQTCAAAAATVHSAVSVGHPKPLSTAQQPHHTTADDVVRHWGSPRGTRADARSACHTLDQHDFAHHGVHAAQQQPSKCV